MSFSIAILAGGLGTRLYPITEAIPKSLIEVAGKPFIVHQIELLRLNQIDRIILCVGHFGERVREVVGDGSKWGVGVDYVFDGPVPLGTGGALKKALPILGETFFVLYGDSYLDIDYQAVRQAFEQSGKPGLMTVYRNLGKWDRSNVLFMDNQIIHYDKRNSLEKMQHIDYGLGFFHQDAFSDVREGQVYDLADVYKNLVIRNQLAGFEVDKRFYEIGSVQGIRETENYILAKKWREKDMGSYVQNHLAEAAQIVGQLDCKMIERIVKLISDLRSRNGRLFFLGVGGGAGHASHAVNDFRKIVGIESYTPTDNVSELTARINDDGWDTTFLNWLKISRLSDRDMIFVFSVGGGDAVRNISLNLVKALEYAKKVGATICGVVGRDGGYTARVADACLIVPTVNHETVTAHTESFQALVWHLLVSHPALQLGPMKWESLTK